MIKPTVGRIVHYYPTGTRTPQPLAAVIACVWSDTCVNLAIFNDNGLLLPWKGLRYVNPPYGKRLGIWLEKLAQHGEGVALIFARTETKAFFDHVWPHAKSLLWIRGRLTFCRPDGTGSKAGHNSGGPSVLIAYGAEADKRLESLDGELGKYTRT